MLNKRTHILFEEEMFQKLQKLAEYKNTSIGDLVRKAVGKTYTEPAENKWEQRRKTFAELKKWRKTLPKFKGRIDYKELIEDGRTR